MELYSTEGKARRVNFRQALFQGLPEDNGLYMPAEIPKLPASFFEELADTKQSDIAYRVLHAFLQDELSEKVLRSVVEEAFNFEAPVVEVDHNTYMLELYHGPTAAFKDFGGRFMSRVMSHYLKEQGGQVHILVATSGDTGGAVGAGFLGVENTRVTILYPSGQVSPLQEQQLTTMGHNVQALEVNGSFDDCQRMVKEAFLDRQLSETYHLSSANSINIGRLLPQMVYYFLAYAQLGLDGKEQVVFTVPSGNFGNLCGGLFAHQMGLPVKHFVAATNANDVVPEYLDTGQYEPRDSVRTISNAMDVGRPSNFARLMDLFAHNHPATAAKLKGFGFTDEETRLAIQELYGSEGYVMCPHTAVGLLGLEAYRHQHAGQEPGVVLATAHPAKFRESVQPLVQEEIALPATLATAMEKQKQALQVEATLEALKAYLVSSA